MYLKWISLLLIHLKMCLSWTTISSHNSNCHRWKYSLCSSGDNVDRVQGIETILICGDGDLSFSASKSNALTALTSSTRTAMEKQYQLVATVLEDRDTHQSIYQGSLDNERIIVTNGNQVIYGVDATQLQNYFPNTYFHRIQFNFPHWKGKANHRYNRQLIDDFMKSASAVLAPEGKIYMALVEGQGGSTSKSLEEYRSTWMPAMYAADHGLLLYTVEPFDMKYNLSSHRGVDRGFSIGNNPKLYIFGKPCDMPIERKYQQCCQHELHILLPPPPPPESNSTNYLMDRSGSETNYTYMDFVKGNAILDILKRIVPHGIVVEVPTRNIIKNERNSGLDVDTAVYLIVYCGEKLPLNRTVADHYRCMAELEIEKYVKLRENRRGRLISRPFPYFLLNSIIESYSQSSILTDAV